MNVSEYLSKCNKADILKSNFLSYPASYHNEFGLYKNKTSRYAIYCENILTIADDDEFTMGVYCFENGILHYKQYDDLWIVFYSE